MQAPNLCVPSLPRIAVGSWASRCLWASLTFQAPSSQHLCALVQAPELFSTQPDGAVTMPFASQGSCARVSVPDSLCQWGWRGGLSWDCHSPFGPGYRAFVIGRGAGINACRRASSQTWLSITTIEKRFKIRCLSQTLE